MLRGISALTIAHDRTRTVVRSTSPLGRIQPPSNAYPHDSNIFRAATGISLQR